MPRTKTAKPGLFLRVVDEKQRLLKTRTTVTLTLARSKAKGFSASSQAGTATEFLLDMPRGEYDLTVAARSYLRHHSQISVERKESRTITITLYTKGVEEQGDAVRRAHSLLSDIRAWPAKLVAVDARMKALKKKKRRPKPPPDPPRKDFTKWTVLGPRNLSGRVRALAAHPTDGEIIYAGSANAGVWITKDGAQTWRSLWFDEDVLEVGALAIHLTDTGKPGGDVTLYAGTGTAEFSPTIFPAYPGMGIYRSTESGSPGTWENMPVPLTDFTAIVVDPASVSADPNKIVLYASGSRGLFESKDGGGSWTQILSDNVRSVALDPSNSQFLYLGVAGQGVLQIDRTTLAAASFNKNNVATSFPDSIMVAIGQSSPFTMYAKYDQVVHRYNRTTNEWESKGAHGGDTYGTWNECLAVDPNNSSIVLSGGVGLERSYDSGDTWKEESMDSDHHAVAFSSSDSLITYVGNDHGVRKGFFSSPDSGWWKKMHNGLILMHYNGLGASGIGPNVIGGGAQDNGTHRTVGGLTWDLLQGGDGGGFIYDPDDPYSMYYAESYSLGNPANGRIYITKDGNTTEPTEADTTGFQGPFVTPMAIDPDSSKSNRILFAGGVEDVQRSTDGGLTWSASSPTLGGEVRSLSVSPLSSAVIFAGTHNGEVWLSTDGGATSGNWKKKTPGTGVTLPNRRLTSVMADPFDDYGVFVTFGGLNSATPSRPGHLFYGRSKEGVDYNWEDFSGDLPDIPCYSLAIDPAQAKRMWIGTDIGVFESNDAAVTWLGDDGLPNVVVTELQIRREKDVLRAATYGWGMWQRRIQPPYPEVDIYIRNNKMDTGEGPPPTDVVDPQVVGTKLYFWESPDIKVSLGLPNPKDGVEFDELFEIPTMRGFINPVWIQVHNRGWKTATNVKVRALWASGASGLPPLPNDFWSTFPGNWSGESDWQPLDDTIPFQTIASLKPHTPAFLFWFWPLPLTASEDSCVLVVISSDQDPVTRSDANPDDLIVDPISVWDKHIAHRNMQVLGLPQERATNRNSTERIIELNNPYRVPDFFSVEINRGTLPKRATAEVLLPKTGSTRLDAQRFLIRARSKVKANVSLSLPNTVKPGDEFRYSVIQRRKGKIIGGNTYVVRVPPAVVRIGGKDTRSTKY